MVKKLKVLSTVTSLKFKEMEIEVPELKATEVFVKIKSCGVCHTDLYSLDKPGFVAGHETVGRVLEVGKLVKHIQVGDLIGFGYLKEACNNCEQCASGHEIMCPDRTIFPKGIGGFAFHAVFNAHFCYKIPTGIEAKYAGPLMCAGATVFTAFTNYNLKPTDRVGIVGIGGLGHLALQFARAWGCHVVAISSSPDKAEEACSFGAHEAWCSKDFTPDYIAKIEQFDYILNTVSGNLPWDDYMSLLKPNGVMVMVGLPEKPMQLHSLPLVTRQLRLTGSLVAGRHDNMKMLDFAARHQIKPKIEEYPMTAEGAAKAVDSVRENTARYRAVLVVPH
ncbi:hypothetical protein NQZ79_g2741 [Umbelopsis isabellina]|nr:hypothetical protein NQZ79_g2741 [Umbelopsis isabellina]